MKVLYILRHAKSSWASPGLADRDRPLNERGERQVQILHDWFSRHHSSGPWPQVETIICSPATRTRQTLEGLRPALHNARLDEEPRLYNGPVDAYLDAMSAREDNSLLLIGHNPACDELLHYLAKPNGPLHEQMIGQHFATAMLAIMTFDTNAWTDIRRGSGTLELFAKPADLPTEL